MLKSLEQDFVTDLYKAFIQDVLAMAQKVTCGGKFLYYADHEGEVPYLDQFGNDLTLCRQKGKTLGERMHQALVECQSAGFKRMVIIGTDCIEITPENIQQTFTNLDHNDYCIGPSSDGGYYLIGACEPQLNVFTGIDWGTDTVQAATLQRFDQLGKSYALLQEKEDMDTLQSVENFYTRMTTTQTSAFHTAEILSARFLHAKKSPSL